MTSSWEADIAKLHRSLSDLPPLHRHRRTPERSSWNVEARSSSTTPPRAPPLQKSLVATKTPWIESRTENRMLKVGQRPPHPGQKGAASVQTAQRMLLKTPVAQCFDDGGSYHKETTAVSFFSA